MPGTQQYAAADAVAFARIGAPTPAYAVPPGDTAHVTARPGARTAPSARIVAPGERVAVAGGGESTLGLPAGGDRLSVRHIVVRGTEGGAHSRLDLN